MNYLLDTCVISELVKPEPSGRVVGWLKAQAEMSLFLSSITFGEIQKGISKLPAGQKQRELQNWLDRDLTERFRNRILPVDARAALMWGRIRAAAEKKGRKIPVIDGLIAAVGMANELTVATRNVGDMPDDGVEIFNPWDDD